MKLMGILLALLLGASAYAAGGVVKSVSVRGEGEVRVRPDKAEVFLQVRTRAKEAKVAQAMNAKEMARVQKVLKSEFKIDSKDVQTSSFYVNPEYRHDQNGKQIFTGYAVEHGLVLSIRELNTLGGLFDSLIGKGTEATAVLLQSVNFGSSKRAEQEIQAMETAMKNAELRASALARFAKRDLKGVLRISDSDVNFQPPPMPGMAKMSMAMESADGGTAISPGEIVIRSTVAVEYQID